MEQIHELSDRQIKILRAIVDEYIATGMPVGSEHIEKKFNVGYSPATIRNEMVVLGKHGYIEKSHFSSGRIPTPKAFRFYINTLLPKKPLSTAEEVSIKNEVWDFQNDEIRFLEEIASVLSEKSSLTSLILMDSGFRYYAGVNHLVARQEIQRSMDIACAILDYLDDIDYWQELLGPLLTSEKEIEILLGEDYGVRQMSQIGSVFSRFQAGSRTGAIGILGPVNIQYETIVPLTMYGSRMITDVLGK